MTMDELIRRRDALRFPELYDLLERNIAPQYDRREALTRLLRLVQDTEKPLVKTLSQHMRLREASVLDLGCGLGHEACNFADAAATAVGLDRDPSR
jgi:ubiquinone/menaquinone biosynthesis C-methylase UbiE